MATIGVSKPYYALYNSTGSTVTYSDGALLGRAAECSLELEGSEANVLYLDNAPAESANDFAGGTITLTTGELLPEVATAILGAALEDLTVEEITTETPKELVYGEAQEIPYVGLGVIIKGKYKGAMKYMGVIFPKVQFTNPGFSAVTQGETIEWQTQELSATIMRDDTAAGVWQRAAWLDSEEDAEAYIKNFLSITGPAA